MSPFHSTLRQTLPYFISLFFVFSVLRIFQIVCGPEEIFQTKIETVYHVKGFIMDFLLALIISAVGFILTFLFVRITKLPYLFFFHLLALISLLANYCLIVYFLKTNQLLGDVFYQLDTSELITSANLDSNLTFFSVIFPILLIVCYFVLGSLLRKVQFGKVSYFGFASLLLLSLAVYPWKMIDSKDYVGDLVINNKLIAFISISEKHFFGGNELDNVSTKIFRELDDSFFPDPDKRYDEYSLVHELEPASKLGNYLNKSPKGPPNIVIIVVESLSSFLVGNNENNPCHFLPFLDSLAKKSLYFPNFMSTCERTHNVLPASLASAPNPPEKEFMQKEELPRHWSLISLLDSYYSRFYCGVDLKFASMNAFMEYNQTDYLVHSWEPQFSIERDKVGSIWGYADDQLFEKSFLDERKLANKQPKLDIFLTISTHEPFAYPRQRHYMDRVQKVLKRSKCTKKQREEVNRLTDMYGSYVFTDDALKAYFKKAATKPDYDNTIFFLFGDHGSPLFPRNEIQKYQTPLLIFSPLLKKTGQFNSVYSHLDLAPTILNYLRVNYPELDLPNQVPFAGKEISFEKPFSSKRTLPLITLNCETKHLIYQNYFQYEGQLYKIRKGMNLTPVSDQKLNNKLSGQLLAYRKLAQYYHDNDKILPREQFRKFARKGKKKTLFNGRVKSIIHDESADQSIFVGPTVTIKKGYRGIEVEFTGEVFIHNRKEFEEFPKMVCSLEQTNEKNLLRWEEHKLKLQHPLQVNKWNKFAYYFFVDVRKYSSSNQKHQLIYYLLNSKKHKIKIRKNRSEVLVWE